MTTATTPLGAVTGVSKHGVQQFLGLPFAAPPIGARRWRAPAPAPAWTGERDGSTFPNRGLQTPYAGVLAGRDIPGDVSEDCLYLNVYTPNVDGKRRPVMVWIHGGAYIQGSANEYDGSALARDNDVVVISINYRLGIFGFMDLSRFGDEYAGSASLGFQDQIAALRWVQANATAFGGDPDNVTIFGESAGAGSVLALLASPSADDLFHKAIAFSPGDVVGAPQDSVAVFAAHLRVAEDAVLSHLLALSGEELVQLQISGVFQGGASIDGTVVTRLTRDAIAERGANGVPLIAGCCKDEGTLFADVIPPEAASVIAASLAVSIGLGDPSTYFAFLDEHYPAGAASAARNERIWYDLFRSAALRNAQATSSAGVGGWVFNFDVPTDNPLGTTHASDVAFTFNSFVLGGDAIGFHEDTPANRSIASLWSATCAHFARTGDPNGAGLPQWPRYDTASRQCLIIDHEPRVEGDPDGADTRAAYRLG